MKKILLMQILLLAFLANNLFAQNDIKEDEVKSTLKEIFKLSKDQNYSDIASLFLFHKDNEKRSFKNNVKAELKSVKRMAKKIKAYLNLSDSYEYESISYAKYLKLHSANLKVNFTSGNQELTITFRFVKLGSQILLAEFK